MTEHPPIRLRYFDARARAQFLRAWLHVRGFGFDDERVPLDEGFASWLAMRPDRSRCGPLQRLPVLHYGDELVPETLVIAAFLHRQSGDAAALSRARSLQHDILLSTACTDLMMGVAMLIWSDAMYPGVDLARSVPRSFERLGRTFDAIDQALAEWSWVDTIGERPVTIADCLLWEELDQAKTLFGPLLDLGSRPELARFYAEHPARDRFASLLAAHPAQITGRPDEAAAIKRLREVLAS